jgi:hypothetical protein
VDISRSARKDTQIIVYLPRVSWVSCEQFLQMTSAIHSARQTTRQYVQGRTNASKEEHRGEGCLDEMCDVHGSTAIGKTSL